MVRSRKKRRRENDGNMFVFNFPYGVKIFILIFFRYFVFSYFPVFSVILTCTCHFEYLHLLTNHFVTLATSLRSKDSSHYMSSSCQHHLAEQHLQSSVNCQCFLAHVGFLGVYRCRQLYCFRACQIAPATHIFFRK